MKGELIELFAHVRELGFQLESSREILLGRQLAGEGGPFVHAAGPGHPTLSDYGASRRRIEMRHQFHKESVVSTACVHDGTRQIQDQGNNDKKKSPTLHDAAHQQDLGHKCCKAEKK